jgi:hypothetical protein
LYICTNKWYRCTTFRSGRPPDLLERVVKRHRSALAFLLSLSLAAGCDDQAPSSGPDGAPDNPDFPPPPVGEGVQLHIARELAPGAEDVVCRYAVLPDRPMDLVRLEHDASPGVHHVVLYPTDLSASEVAGDLQPFACAGRGDLRQTGVLYGSSAPSAALQYPDEVGAPLQPGAVVLLETHHINTGDSPLATDTRFNLWFARDPVSTEAGTLFFYDWAIYLPPAPATASARMRCEVPEDIQLLYASSHMHRRGTGFSASIEPAGGAPPVTLHETSGGDVPAPSVFIPEIPVSAGSIIEFRCDYRNDLDRTVVEGPSAEHDEMCIFGATYYPRMSRTAELCLVGQSGPVLEGSRSCEETVGCMLEAGVGNWIGGQACVADTCAPSAPALSRFVHCVSEHSCWGSASCVSTHCLPEWNACTAASC